MAQKKDSVEHHSYAPTGLRFGTDILSLAKIPLSNQFNGWEVNADMDFYKYYATIDVGSWAKTIESETQRYTNNGNYFRVGADVNLLLKDPDRNMFFIGLRYGHSSFKEQLDFIASDPVFGNLSQRVTNSSAKAGWGEITVGLRVKVWRAFWMGYTARMKLSPIVNNKGGQFDTYDIPGYGLASKSTYWGFNYQLFYRIPLKQN